MKQTIKQKKEAAERAALLRRVLDIYAGANGGPVDEDEAATVGVIQRVMSVVNYYWVVGQGDNRAHLIKHWNVDEYETPEKATALLFGVGIRAGRA